MPASFYITPAAGAAPYASANNRHGWPGTWLRLRDRAHLDRPVPGGRDAGRHVDRLVQVLALHDEEAGDLLPGLGERAVGDHDVAAVPAPDGGGGLHRVQLLAGEEHAALPHLVLERGARRHPAGSFLVADHGALVGAHQQGITHDASFRRY